MTGIPKSSRYVVVTNYNHDLRKATEIRELPIPELQPTEVLVKMKFVGVNAVDASFAAGRKYFRMMPPPFPCGTDGLGEIVKAGSKSKYKVGNAVAVFTVGAYGEYVKVDESVVTKVPSLDPKYLAIRVSGPTASVALEKLGELQKGEVVLVTGASGGTGHIAVQLAKAAGCTVVGTCSSAAKAEFLKSIGCDRPINYRSENVSEVLKKEYPNGVNVVYETVGGELFEAALENIAPFGRIIQIGQTSTYNEPGDKTAGPVITPESKVPIAATLNGKGASLRGFNLLLYGPAQQLHSEKLNKMYAAGKLKPMIDLGEDSPKGPFRGLESVPDAMDYLFARKNKGKVMIELGADEVNVKL